MTFESLVGGAPLLCSETICQGKDWNDGFIAQPHRTGDIAD